MIYLDNAATTYPKPNAVYTAMDYINRNCAVNTGRGSYKAAREMTALVDETRDMLLDLFHGTGVADVVFTPSVTHGINQVLHGLDYDTIHNIYVSPYEHNAVARTIEQIKNEKEFNVFVIPLNQNYEIDIDRLKYDFSHNVPDLIICTAISNVTGYLLPFGNLFAESKRVNSECVTVLDAAQAAGLIDIDINSNIDILCFAGHKTLYGPFGIAGFVIKKNIDLSVVLTGGTGSDSLNKEMPSIAPLKYEASSPNIVAIAGLNASLKELDLEVHLHRVLELTTYLYSELQGLPNTKVLGYNGHNIAIASFVIDGYSSSDVGSVLDSEFDISVRTGYHCCPDIHDLINDKSYGGTVRVSVGMFNTKEDIDVLIDAINSL